MLIVYLLFSLLSFYLFSNRFHFNPNPTDGGLFLCWDSWWERKAAPDILIVLAQAPATK